MRCWIRPNRKINEKLDVIIFLYVINFHVNQTAHSKIQLNFRLKIRHTHTHTHTFIGICFETLAGNKFICILDVKKVKVLISKYIHECVSNSKTCFEYITNKRYSHIYVWTKNEISKETERK